MKKCTRCGRTYDAGEFFCKSCGTALAEATAAGGVALDRGHAEAFDPLRARNRIILMVALMNVVVFAVFGCGVLWMMFKTVQTSLHDESINQMLIFTDGLGVRASKFLQAGDMNSIQQLLQETKANSSIAYGFIRAADGRMLASTFEGNAVPDALKNINELNKGMPFGTQETRLISGPTILNVVDIASAIAEGAQGSIHIGLNADSLQNGITHMFFPVVIFSVGLFIISVSVQVALTAILTGRILRVPARSKL